MSIEDIVLKEMFGGGGDISDSVVGEMFGLDLDDDFGEDEGDDEYGILGIALSKKAKAKKWAKKWDEARIRLLSLKRLRDQGRETAFRKRKGPISLIDKKKQIDIDKQMEKLKKDMQKAGQEFQKLGLGSPSGYLRSIGEQDHRARSRDTD